jgi:uncharacterized membrane protein HdeD (DUF308 family)
MSADTLSGTVKRVTGLAIVWAVILIICGIVALALPVMAGISTAYVLAVLIIIAGVVHLTTAAVAGSFGGYLWRTLVGIVYIIGGVWLFIHPVLALSAFTLVLGIIFMIEGILGIISFFQIKKNTGSGWVLFDGIITLLLALLILYHWPSSAAWAVATIVGVNLLISGVTALMALLAIRRALKVAA